MAEFCFHVSIFNSSIERILPYLFDDVLGGGDAVDVRDGGDGFDAIALAPTVGCPPTCSTAAVFCSIAGHAGHATENDDAACDGNDARYMAN